MRHYNFCFLVIIFSIVLGGCQSNPDVQIDETNSESVSYQETIRMNNCGGKDTSEQTIQKSFSTSIEGTAQLKIGNGVVEGSVSGKYGEYRNTIKSQTLKAPPGTNMEFILMWSEDVRAGNVTVKGENAKYSVHIPNAVELVSSKDIGCEQTTEEANWVIEFQYRFPENFWSSGTHEYTIEMSCPNMSEPESRYGKWTNTFDVTKNANLFDGEVYLRLSGLKNYQTNTENIKSINPNQPTIIAFGFNEATKDEVDLAVQDCFVTASWDGNELEQLLPTIPFQQ